MVPDTQHKDGYQMYMVLSRNRSLKFTTCSSKLHIGIRTQLYYRYRYVSKIFPSILDILYKKIKFPLLQAPPPPHSTYTRYFSSQFSHSVPISFPFLFLFYPSKAVLFPPNPRKKTRARGRNMGNDNYLQVGGVPL